MDKRSAMRVSLHRRQALHAMKTLDSPHAALDRVAAVWERVLDAATKRLEALDRLPAPKPSMLSVPGRRTSGEHDVMRWERRLDPVTWHPYFVNESGSRSLWAADTGPSSKLDGCKCWSLCTDRTSGAMYMQNHRTGEAVWVISDPCTSVSGETESKAAFWTLCLDPSSTLPYFTSSEDAGISEWCTDPQWQSGCDGRHFAIGSWQRFVDRCAACSYFVHVSTGFMLWGSPLLNE